MMLNGVVVDPLTDEFLGVATDLDLGRSIHDTLRHYLHDARNRMSFLKMSLYLAKKDSAGVGEGVWTELNQSYCGLETLVDRVESICRPSTFSPVTGRLGSWLKERRATWTGWLESRGRSLEWDPPETEDSGRFDPKRLIEGLDALIRWRSNAGRDGERARLSWGVDGDHLFLVWSEPAARCDEPIEGRESRALSLAFPLLARVMADHRGSLDVSSAEGLTVGLTWPRNLDPSPPA